MQVYRKWRLQKPHIVNTMVIYMILVDKSMSSEVKRGVCGSFLVDFRLRRFVEKKDIFSLNRRKQFLSIRKTHWSS